MPRCDRDPQRQRHTRANRHAHTHRGGDRLAARNGDVGQAGFESTVWVREYSLTAWFLNRPAAAPGGVLTPRLRGRLGVRWRAAQSDRERDRFAAAGRHHRGYQGRSHHPQGGARPSANQSVLRDRQGGQTLTDVSRGLCPFPGCFCSTQFAAFSLGAIISCSQLLHHTQHLRVCCSGGAGGRPQHPPT